MPCQICGLFIYMCFYYHFRCNIMYIAKKEVVNEAFADEAMVCFVFFFPFLVGINTSGLLMDNGVVFEWHYGSLLLLFIIS